MKRTLKFIAAATLVCAMSAACGELDPDNGNGGNGNGENDEQEKPTPDPDAKLVKAIAVTGEYDFKNTFTFTYDDQNRITKIAGKDTYYGDVAPNPGQPDENQGNNEEKIVDLEITFEYTDHAVSYQIRSYDNGKEIESEKVRGDIKLNDKGYATSGSWQEYDEHPQDLYTYTLEYDANNCLVRSDGDEGGESIIKWANGNIEGVKWIFEDNSDKLDDTATYGQVKNQSNLDLNWTVLSSEGFDFAPGDPYKLFAVLGFCGTRTANLPDKTIISYPGSETKYDNTHIYELDADGDVTKIISTFDASSDDPTKIAYEIIYTK